MLEKNLGIQLLRICLAFWVVLQHCLSDKYQNRLEYFFSKIKLHVPCFILISFFFSCKTITGRNIFKIKQRFIRLLIPYAIYPIEELNTICNTKNILDFNENIFKYFDNSIKH